MVVEVETEATEVAAGERVLLHRMEVALDAVQEGEAAEERAMGQTDKEGKEGEEPWWFAMGG